MCKFLLSFLSIIAFLPALSYGQQVVYTGLYDSMYNSIISPDTFNQWVVNNSNLFGANYDRCYETKIRGLATTGNQHHQHCQQMTDPTMRQQCIANNASYKLAIWLYDINQVVRSNAQWLETTTGRNIVEGMALCRLADQLAASDPALPGNMCEEMFIRPMLAQFQNLQPALTCRFNN